jgi:hypothetical protein
VNIWSKHGFFKNERTSCTKRPMILRPPTPCCLGSLQFPSPERTAAPVLAATCSLRLVASMILLYNQPTNDCSSQPLSNFDPNQAWKMEDFIILFVSLQHSTTSVSSLLRKQDKLRHAAQIECKLNTPHLRDSDLLCNHLSSPSGRLLTSTHQC